MARKARLGETVRLRSGRPVQVDVDPSDEDGHFYVRAHSASGAPLGRLVVALEEEYARVGWISVEDRVRREGLATKLYEAAARASCARRGIPLASDVERSGKADAFWKKQEAKGRARCVSRWEDEAGSCRQYALACPAPASLEGPKKKRRRRR